MRLIISSAEEEIGEFDDAPVPLRTDYPSRKKKVPKTEGTYPTEYNMDKHMFQASVPFKPTDDEILEVAEGLDTQVREQLESLVTAKTRWLIIPPKGHEDLPKKMLIKQFNKIIILDEKDGVVRPSNTHEFENAKEAEYWLNNTIDQLKKAHYKVV